MGGSTDFTWWGKARVTPWMSYQLGRLDADLKKNFGVGLVANSGIRLPQEQIDIFLARYVTAANVRGRKVYDTRWWNGQLWYRISPAGTVAVPSTSNHEIQGSKAAVDIADTGVDAGVSSKTSARGRWIRANAPNYDLVASGDGFGEGWHFDILHIFNVPPNTPTPEEPVITKEEEMWRVIESPAYTAAGQRILIWNDVMNTVPAGWVQNLITHGKVQFASYPLNDMLVAEVNLFYTMKGMSDAEAIRETQDALKAVLDPADVKATIETQKTA